MARDTNKDRRAKQARRMIDRTVIIPPPKNKARRKRASLSLEYHLKTYHRETFPEPFSADHKEAMKIIQDAVLHGGHFSWCMPRGSGKTCIAEGATEWMTFHGHRKFPIIVGASASAAGLILESIRTEIETNDKLADDFPEICLPVRELEGRGQRCKGQLARLENQPQDDAKLTGIVWGGDRLVLPTVDGSASSAAVIMAVGLDASLRGIKHKGRDGKSIRPDFALCDDPQTDESAKSTTQTDYRERLILGAVLGLAGPRRKMAAVMGCTIMYRGDLADRFTDSNLHPDWQGRRMKMVYAWPEALDLWKEYAAIRRRGMAEGDNGKAATAFYKERRVAMDKGAKVAWDSRKNAGELSAIQHAWNLRIDRGEDVFAAEYQNEPLQHVVTVYDLKPDVVMARCNGRNELVLPGEPVVITGGVDLNRYGLSWCLIASTRLFCSSVLAYGVHTVAGSEAIYREGQTEAEAVAFYRALDDLFKHLAQLRFMTASGQATKIRRLGIDAGYLPKVVRSFAGNSGPWPWETIATRGRDATHYRDGGPNVQSKGENWIELLEPDRPGPLVIYHSDIWAESTQTGFLLPLGAPGGMDVFGKPEAAAQHSEFAGHICAQKLAEKLPSDKGHLYRWTQGGRNDLLDAAIIARVLASHSGCSLLASAIAQKQAENIPEKPAEPPKQVKIEQSKSVSYDANWQ